MTAAKGNRAGKQEQQAKSGALDAGPGTRQDASATPTVGMGFNVSGCPRQCGRSPGADAFCEIICLPPSSLAADSASTNSASPLAAPAEERLPALLPAFLPFLPVGELLGVLSAAMLPAAAERGRQRERQGREGWRWAGEGGGRDVTACTLHLSWCPSKARRERMRRVSSRARHPPPPPVWPELWLL